MKLSNFVIFSAGAAIGSLVTWKLVKDKYEKIAQEEIDSVKEVYEKKRIESGSVKETDDISEEESKEVLRDYSTIIKDNRYKNRNDISDDEEETYMKDKPYVIPPDEFGDYGDYDLVSLTYYSDGVLTDSWDNVIKNVEEMVGEESLDHFGEYEDDSVFVRNHKLETDFEILLDLRNFADIPKVDNNE